VPGADALLPSNSLKGGLLRGATSDQESGWITHLGSDALLPSNSMEGGLLRAATSDQKSEWLTPLGMLFCPLTP